MVKIGPIVLGDGHTKVCVPLVGRTEEAILEECRYLADKPFDVAELRIDYFEGARSIERVKALLSLLRSILNECDDGKDIDKGKGLLFTWRTKNEGGELDITVKDYFALLDEVILSGLVDAIDIEYFFDQKAMVKTVDLAKKHNVTVVMSNHDFHKTPSVEEIKSRLIGMKEAGADIAKLACMPNSPKDVLILLEATESVKQQYPEEPIITMSMGKLGVISRICGSVFGNAMTFGAAKQVSAPGQIELEKLHAILEVVD